MTFESIHVILNGVESAKYEVEYEDIDSELGGELTDHRRKRTAHLCSSHGHGLIRSVVQSQAGPVCTVSLSSIDL